MSATNVGIFDAASLERAAAVQFIAPTNIRPSEVALLQRIPVNWGLLTNSLFVAGTTTVVSVGLGFVVALRLATASRRTRSLLWLGALATLALPPFLVVNSWLELFGASGALRDWLPVRLPIYSVGGAVGILTGMLWPLSALLIVGAWDRVEPAQLEGDPMLRGAALLRWVLWPAARGATGLAAVLTFVLAFNQFSVPVILQVAVFPEELWLSLTARLNASGAWAAAVPMVLAPVLLVLALRRRPIDWPRWPRDTGPSHPATMARQLGRGWGRLAMVMTVVVLGMGLILPLGQLLGQPRTWVELPSLLKSSPEAVRNSFLLAFLTATLGLATGLLARRWRAGWLLWLLFFIPGILLSHALIGALGGTLLYGTMAMVLVAFVLHHAAIGWQGAFEAERSLDRDLLDAGRLEGARGWRLFQQYGWPQMARPLAATWYVTYLLALWDVETLVLIHPPGGDTLPLRIFQLLHYGHNAQVNAMCVILLGLAVAPVMVWKVVRFIEDIGRGG